MHKLLQWLRAFLPGKRRQPLPAFPDDAPWIGVDLDGTLARFEYWYGFSHIGKPIPAMMERVHDWIAEGYKVKIFTARAAIDGAVPPIQAWLRRHGLEGLEITCEKDDLVLEIWDDRAIQVIVDTGQPVRSPSIMARPKSPLIEEIFPHERS